MCGAQLLNNKFDFSAPGSNYRSKSRAMSKILLIDDDQDILRLAERLLASVGHTVTSAENGLKGLEWAQKQKFELIICDVKMPIVSGFDLTKAIRQNFSRDEVKLILMTGVKDPASIERAIRMGVHDYIVKPFSPQILLEKVDRVLTEKKVG